MSVQYARDVVLGMAGGEQHAGQGENPRVALGAQGIEAVADDRRGEFEEAEIDVILRQAGFQMRGQRGEFGHRAGIAAAMAAEHDAGFLERVALDWGLLKHGWGSRRQNSMPFWAFTPAWKGCLISVISVTRSAASISSGLALRPVTTICSCDGRAFSVSTTSARSR